MSIMGSCQKTKTNIDNITPIAKNDNAFKEDALDSTVGLELEVVFDNSLVQGIANNNAR